MQLALRKPILSFSALRQIPIEFLALLLQLLPRFHPSRGARTKTTYLISHSSSLEVLPRFARAHVTLSIPMFGYVSNY